MRQWTDEPSPNSAPLPGLSIAGSVAEMPVERGSRVRCVSVASDPITPAAGSGVNDQVNRPVFDRVERQHWLGAHSSCGAFADDINGEFGVGLAA